MRTPLDLEAQIVWRRVETPEEAPAVRKISSALAEWPSRSAAVQQSDSNQSIGWLSTNLQ